MILRVSKVCIRPKRELYLFVLPNPSKTVLPITEEHDVNITWGVTEAHLICMIFDEWPILASHWTCYICLYIQIWHQSVTVLVPPQRFLGKLPKKASFQESNITRSCLIQKKRSGISERKTLWCLAQNNEETPTTDNLRILVYLQQHSPGTLWARTILEDYLWSKPWKTNCDHSDSLAGI